MSVKLEGELRPCTPRMRVLKFHPGCVDLEVEEVAVLGASICLLGDQLCSAGRVRARAGRCGRRSPDAVGNQGVASARAKKLESK